MAKVTFTAWKNKAQLLEVRREFYPPPSYEGPDMRAHACAMVAAWKLRGNIPHHVEATALLTDAILHDDAQRNSIFSIRATYSAAFCRFVTGLVDSKIHGQRKTMFQRAVDLGLPASFVELRHEATHREPPSLVVLRKATQRSLEWLWDNYWAGVDDSVDAPGIELSELDDISIISALVGVLRSFMDGSASESTGPTSQKRRRDQADSVAARLVSICNAASHESSHASSQGVSLLSTVLANDPFLFGSDRKLGEALDWSFDKWDPILLRILESHPFLAMYLSEALAHSLVFNPANNDPESARAEAVYLWLVHIFTSPRWDRTYRPLSYILTICSERPIHWSKLLAEQLREHKNLSSTVPDAQDDVQICLSSQDASDSATESADTLKLREHGWEPVKKWDCRPLGTTSS